MNIEDDESRMLLGEEAVSSIGWFAERFSFEQIGPAALEQARRLLLMGIAWSVLGSRCGSADVLLEAFHNADVAGSAVVLGRRRRVGCADAAFFNAATAQVYDCNDGFPGWGAYHPGRVLLPVALAVGESCGASGRDLLTALVLGYEVAYRAYSGKPRARCDGIGAACVAAKLLGLPAERISHAVVMSDQHGPFVYPGPQNFNADANHLCNGYVARAAVESALLANVGVMAHGSHDLYFDERPPLAEERLEYYIEKAYIKPFIACRICHNPIEAGLEFSRKYACQDVERVDVNVVTVADFVAQRVERDASFKTAFFSIPYSLACALIDGEVDELQAMPVRIAAADVQELQRRVFVTVDNARCGEFPADAYPAEIRFRLKDGTILTDSRLHPKGSHERPLSSEEITELFMRWTGSSFTDVQKERVVEMVCGLDEMDDMGALWDLLVNPTKRV